MADQPGKDGKTAADEARDGDAASKPTGTDAGAEAGGDTKPATDAKPVPLEGEAKKAAEERLATAEKNFAERQGPKGKLFSLFHGEEHHGLILEKKLAKMHLNGATAEQIAEVEKAGTKGLGMLEKIRPGKTAAVAGAVAVTGMVLASMGNKGPGDQAASVESSRDDQQVARA